MVKIDRDKCIVCGNCAAVCPQGFEIGNDGKLHVKDPKASCIGEAISSCPVEAISKYAE